MASGLANEVENRADVQHVDHGDCGQYLDTVHVEYGGSCYGMPIPEEVEEPHLGGEVEEDCGAGGQEDTGWLEDCKNDDENTESYGNTITSSANGVGRGKNKLELGHNQFSSKCNTRTTSNQINWNSISFTSQSCQYQSDIEPSKVISSSMNNINIQQIRNTDNTNSNVLNKVAEPHTIMSNTKNCCPLYKVWKK